jgi:teichuronic acid biosynthesis glycosyltransferase TuaC
MRVLIVTAMWPTEENPAFGSFVRTQVDALRAVGLEIEVLVLEGRVRKLIYPRGMWQIRRRLRQQPADLVHAHFGYCGIVARTQRRVPVVVTFHGDDVLGTINAKGAVTFASRIAAAASRLIARHIDAAIVQTKEMAVRLDCGCADVIPHEVDLERFRPIDRGQARALLGLDPSRPYVLFAASPGIPVKRYPLARDAVAELRKRMDDVELVVVHREPQDRLCLYMNACDVLAFPSFQEGSPNIVKQALACNMPIVSTDVGDVREIIEGTPGCTIAPPDTLGFAAALEAQLHAGGRSSGRVRVAHLACDEVAQQVAAVYRRVLSRRGSTREKSLAAAEGTTDTTGLERDGRASTEVTSRSSEPSTLQAQSPMLPASSETMKAPAP